VYAILVGLRQQIANVKESSAVEVRPLPVPIAPFKLVNRESGFGRVCWLIGRP
jgi:hypothetical protein